MIKSLFWNIKGVNNCLTLNRLKKLKRLHKFSLLGICEPMIGRFNLNCFRVKLGFQHAIANVKGQIWVLLYANFRQLLINLSNSWQFEWTMCCYTLHLLSCLFTLHVRMRNVRFFGLIWVSFLDFIWDFWGPSTLGAIINLIRQGFERGKTRLWWISPA